MSEDQPTEEKPTNPVPASQPAAPVAPAPTAAPVGQPAPPVVYAQNPGDTLGIIGLVLNFFGINIGGIILGVMSRNRSREAGFPTTLGTVSMIWGIVGTVLGFLALAFFILMLVLAASSADYESVGPSIDSSSVRDFETSGL